MDKSLQTTFVVIGVLMVLSAVVVLVTGSDTVTPAVIALAGASAIAAAQRSESPD